MEIIKNLTIDDSEIKFKFTRSSGPGGQNVNKTSSAVTLCFDITESKSLSVQTKKRLLNNLRRQLTKEGQLIMRSDKFRYQNLNRSDVANKFKNTIVKALKIPRRRIPTMPSPGSQKTRLENKRLKGIVKKNRRLQSSDLW